MRTIHEVLQPNLLDQRLAFKNQFQGMSDIQTGAPDCGQTGSVTVEKDLGNIKTQPYSYSVIDQTGFEVWEGIVNLKANTCIQFELRGGKKKASSSNDQS